METEKIYNLLHSINQGKINPNKAYGELCFLFGVMDMYCRCDELLNINDSIIGIDICVKCNKVINRQY